MPTKVGQHYRSSDSCFTTSMHSACILYSIYRMCGGTVPTVLPICSPLRVLSVTSHMLSADEVTLVKASQMSRFCCIVTLRVL